MTHSTGRRIPLITLAFIAYAGGLLSVFLSGGAAGGHAALACAALLFCTALATRRTVLFALTVLFVSGAAVARVAPPPLPPWERPAAGLQPVRTDLGRRIDALFGGQAQIARALLIADQRQLPLDARDRYATAGLVHMLSISGLHVAIIASSLELVLLAMRLRRRTAALVAVALVFAYVAVLDWRAPALRAAVMYGTMSASRALQRPTSPWASLAIGGWIPLLSPRTVLDLGYQLSLCGMAALTGAGLLARRWKLEELGRLRAHVARDLLTSTFASITTAPLVAWYFGRLSIVGPLANLFAGPVISVLQPTLFLALLLSPFAAAASFVADAARPLLALFDAVARAAANLPFASLDVAPTLFGATAAGLAALMLIVAAAGRRPGRALVAGAGAIALTACIPLLPRGARDVELHMLDVGQGDALALRTDLGNWVLFDAGRIWTRGDAGRAVVVPYVRRRGGDVLALVLSHPHADHVGGAASVIRWLRPATVWDPAYVGSTVSYRDALARLAERRGHWRRVRPGDSLVADGVKIRFLAPDSTWAAALDDPNEASAVALVTFGAVRLLLTGDAERGEEEWLLRHARDSLDVDILKVAHHGSSTSSTASFIHAVSPLLALVSVGAENAYSHPSPGVIGRLESAGARVLRTDMGGTVIVRTNGRRISARQGGGDWVSLRD